MAYANSSISTLKYWQLSRKLLDILLKIFVKQHKQVETINQTVVPFKKDSSSICFCGIEADHRTPLRQILKDIIEVKFIDKELKQAIQKMHTIKKHCEISSKLINLLDSSFKSSVLVSS